jgi:hypothetical protein
MSDETMPLGVDLASFFASLEYLVIRKHRLGMMPFYPLALAVGTIL